MDSNTSVFVSTSRSANGALLLYVVILVALGWTATPDAIAFEISSGYWYRSLPVAIPVGVFTAWKFQSALVGRSYKLRSGPERTFGLSESWMASLAGATLLVLVAVCGSANAMNQMIGTLYTATFTVTGKYIVQGKHACYGLTLTNTDDPADLLKICMSHSQQDAIAIQDVLQVNGRRSPYVNEVFSYVKKP